MCRSRCSRCRDLSVHDAPIPLFTIGRFPQADRTVGEVAKLTQLPLNAPKRFRRLRSGRRFLKPRRKDPAWTGTVVRRVADPQRAAFAAEPMVRHRNSEIPMRCAEIEESRIQRADSAAIHADFDKLSKSRVMARRPARVRQDCEMYDIRTASLVIAAAGNGAIENGDQGPRNPYGPAIPRASTVTSRSRTRARALQESLPRVDPAT
jgi:hypothetical protein